ncbi:MAG: hypothetical protein IPI14_12685 [Polaromonas sp.]|nr:hypothetical protein [Polaromonas sp.]
MRSDYLNDDTTAKSGESADGAEGGRSEKFALHRQMKIARKAWAQSLPTAHHAFGKPPHALTDWTHNRTTVR